MNTENLSWEWKSFIDLHRDDLYEILKFRQEIFVVEQNRDAQLRSLLITETNTSSEKLIPVLYYGGQPISCKDIVDPIAERIRKEKAA